MMCWTFLDNVTQQHQLQNDKTPSSELTKQYLPATVDQKSSDQDKISFCVYPIIDLMLSKINRRQFFLIIWGMNLFLFLWITFFFIFMGLDDDYVLKFILNWNEGLNAAWLGKFIYFLDIL